MIGHIEMDLSQGHSPVSPEGENLYTLHSMKSSQLDTRSFWRGTTRHADQSSQSGAALSLSKW